MKEYYKEYYRLFDIYQTTEWQAKSLFLQFTFFRTEDQKKNKQ